MFNVALDYLLDEVKRALDAEHRPAGYNVGFSAGSAAGQTVMHLHVHVIPRYATFGSSFSAASMSLAGYSKFCSLPAK